MPIQYGPSLVEEKIKIALFNSLSMDEMLRKQSFEFLNTQFEHNPELQLSLISIITQNYTLHESPPAFFADHSQKCLMQYQAIIFMKNSLSRLLKGKRNKVHFSNPQAGTQMEFTSQLRETIKA